MGKKECKGETFPKNVPHFYLHQEDILKQEGFLRVGKIKVDNKDMFIVEDQWSATKYKDRDCALDHYEDNLRINKAIKEMGCKATDGTNVKCRGEK